MSIKILNKGIVNILDDAIIIFPFKGLLYIEMRRNPTLLINFSYETGNRTINYPEFDLMREDFIQFRDKWIESLNSDSSKNIGLEKKLDKLLDHIDILPDGKEYNEVKEKFSTDVVKNDLQK